MNNAVKLLALPVISDPSLPSASNVANKENELIPFTTRIISPMTIEDYTNVFTIRTILLTLSKTVIKQNVIRKHIII